MDRFAQYTVREDIIVPTGRASANTDWGTGGYTQFYIDNFENLLEYVTEWPLT